MTHGVRSAYTAGCRCTECTIANRAYGQERARRLAQVKWNAGEPTLIDAQPVKDHLEGLRRAGFSLTQLAQLAETSETTIKILLGMKRDRPARRIRPELAERILNVTGNHHPERGMVPSLGTRRRLQALVRIGYSTYQLAELLDTTPTHVAHWIKRSDRVLATTAAKIADLYRQLEMTPGPSSRGMIRARRLGWHPPLAWDDPDTDENPLI
jgi:plasmid maintenance system antidote protein VapI